MPHWLPVNDCDGIFRSEIAPNIRYGETPEKIQQQFDQWLKNTDLEKINISINISFYRNKNLTPETPNYQAVLDANNTIIEQNSKYLKKVNRLFAFDKQMINIYFDSALFSSDLPKDIESVNRFFR